MKYKLKVELLKIQSKIVVARGGGWGEAGVRNGWNRKRLIKGYELLAIR